MNEWNKEIVIRKNMGTKWPPSYPNEMLVKLMSSKKYSNITHNLFDKKLMVCELGCFSGNNLRFFLDKNDHVHGVELNSEMVNLCEENLVRLGYKVPKLKIGSNLNIPYKNEYFDLFYTINTLHYTYGEDTLKAIEEYARVVKKGGCVVIETISPDHFTIKGSIRHEVLKREWNYGGFRDGALLGIFDNKQHFNETLQLYFDKVEVHSRSEITENTKSEWFIGICIK